MLTFSHTALPPILDVCAVQAGYGHLLVLTADGSLHGLDLDTTAKTGLCKVELPELPTDGNQYFGGARYRLHASVDGRHAAVVVDQGRYGVMVDVLSGAVTLRLDGGHYHEDTVPFSACFLRHEGRNVLVHRTDWNRLDVADAATGRSLTDRTIGPVENGERPDHYLDYFHGQLRLSPDGSRLFDDGWVWQPVSVPRVWSATDWLSSNPWESEDGPSVVGLTMRDDWTTPACWLSDRHVALWGLATWDVDEFAEAGKGPGVRIFDVTQADPSLGEPWPMDVPEAGVRALFSDGKVLYVASDTGTTVWNIASRAKVAELPGFVARLLHTARHTLVAFGPESISATRTDVFSHPL